MIYLASPYSHPDPRVMQHRYELARDYAAAQKSRGILIFSPIAYGHQFTMSGKIAGDHVTWLAFNMHMLKHSIEMHVLDIDGVADSKGVDIELRYSAHLGLPIKMVKP
jgi:hypothetical protein